MAVYDINGNVISESGESILNLKDTVDIESAYTEIPMSEYASNETIGTDYTIYTLNNLLKGDTIKFKRGYNGQSGLIKNPNGEVTESATFSEFVYGTIVLDNDYETLTVQTYDIEFSKVYHRKESNKNRPSFFDEFVPTINDEESNAIKTLSSEKIYKLIGVSEAKAKEIQGGVWIALGDSYTVYADTYFKEIASKYGMIYDGQGKVSSTICGDSAGNKGFSPFWARMDTFINAYTGDGQTIDDVVYTAEDVKLITFMGGANDGFGKDTWLGSPTSKDTNYIYGALNYIFGKLTENFPNAEIIVILQPANYNYKVSSISDDASAQTVGFTNLAELQTLSDYEYSQYAMTRKEKCVKEIAEKFGFHLVDCIFNWYNVINPTHRTLYWNPDKIHLTSLGSSELSKKLDKKIIEVFGKM